MFPRALTLGAMCLAVVMVQLDTTVVNLALRPIQRGLHTDVATLQWVIDAYNLVYATLILTGSILGDRFGRKRLFLIGAAFFAVGTAVSAVAPNALILILSRLVTGVGAAVALPISLSIVTATYTDEDVRHRATAVWAGVNGVAIAIGPTVGGILVDDFGWRAIFWLFLPVAALSSALTAIAVAESKSTQAHSLDLPGQVLAIAALGLLTFGVIEGPTLHWNGAIVAALGGSILAAVAFVRVERRTSDPLIQLDIFSSAAFTGAIAVTLTMTFGWYSFIFIVPNYLQTVLKLSALTAGLLLIPNGVFFAGLAPLAGDWMAKTGARRLIVGGMTLQALGFLTTLALGMNGPIWLVIVQTTLLGVALAFEGGPLMSVAMRSVPKDRYGMPSGIVNVTRITGATIGVAVLGSIFATHAGGTTPNPAKFIAGTHLAMLVAACATFLAALVAFVSIERPAADRLLKRQIWIGAQR
jgi:MFS transporter, DHA2 family, methylenomycin A resistance protein